MKTTIVALALAIVVASQPAVAGSLSDPVVAPEVVVEETEADSGNVQGLLAFFAAATILMGAAGAF